MSEAKKSSLRGKLVRKAHANPHLREKLLPLITDTKMASQMRKLGAKKDEKDEDDEDEKE